MALRKKIFAALVVAIGAFTGYGNTSAQMAPYGKSQSVSPVEILVYVQVAREVQQPLTSHTYQDQPIDQSELQLTREQVANYARKAGFTGIELEMALSVAWCESQYYFMATGDAGERGLWQIHPKWHYDSTYDPLGNAMAAYRISSGGTDWTAWSCKP